MDVNRRNLMKGMLTGGTLLALGIPGVPTAATASAGSSVGKSRGCALLLGNTAVDDAFAKGASSAHAACSAHSAHLAGLSQLQLVKLKGGLLVEMDRVAELLALSPGSRWVVLLDDASAAVFTEMVRNAGARLLSRGSHVASRHDSAFPAFPNGSATLRHLWTSPSRGHSAGAILASRLMGNHGSFSIVENFLGEAASAGEMTTGYQPEHTLMTAAGFRSYRSTGAGATYLHCSGVSPSDGCKLLGWDTAGGWMQFSESDEHESPRRAASADWQPANWVESLGYAITAAAFGMGEEQESGASRGFVHRANDSKRGNPSESVFPEERFASFIIDV